MLLAKLKSTFNDRRRAFSRVYATSSAPSYPSVPPNQRFFDPSQADPIASTSQLPPPIVKTQEEQDAETAQALFWSELCQVERDELAARELYAREQREMEQQMAEDERLVLDMIEMERRKDETEKKNDEDAARRIEADLRELERRESGAVVECEVCSGDAEVQDALQCPEGHLICKECAVGGSSAAFEMLDATLPCLAVGDCGSTYSPDQVRKFLDERAWARYEQLRLDADVAALADAGLRRCPFCAYAVILDDPTLVVLDCLSPDCFKKSCITCNKLDHRPLTCEQASLTPLQRLQEEMSDALIRRCGKCTRPYVKTAGCNLITCANSTCRAKSCYLCQELVVGYEHFKDPGPCNGKTFADKSVVEKVQAIRDRGLSTIEKGKERDTLRKMKLG